MAKVFVQIASYRDPELPFTIQDLLAKATFPKDIRIGICNQGTAADWSPPSLKALNIAQEKVPYAKSKGTCWARHRVQQLYEGEEFTLQIDSHHRFVQGWDAKLLGMIEQVGSAKPLFSAYLPAYDGAGHEAVMSDHAPGKQVFTKFDYDNIVHFVGMQLSPEEQLAPTRARFTSGHFVFGPGAFIEEVPYDPSVYFTGEEITLALRAYTHGYDIYHPHQTVIYHAYGRTGNKRHWDDHNQEESPKAKVHWPVYQKESVRRIRAVLTEPESVPAPYGLGRQRTLRDYELYAGLSFRGRLAHQNAVDGLEPPSTHCWNWEWAAAPCHERLGEVTTKWSKPAPDPAVDFWYFGLHDRAGLELCRMDLRDPDYLCGKRHAVPVHFWSREAPRTYTLIPHRKTGEWGERLIRPLSRRNFKDHFAP